MDDEREKIIFKSLSMEKSVYSRPPKIDVTIITYQEMVDRIPTAIGHKLIHMIQTYKIIGLDIRYDEDKDELIILRPKIVEVKGKTDY